MSMLTVDEALAAILKSVCTSTAESVPLQESLGLVLAENLSTPHDSPPFDKSMMDGFAVQASVIPTVDPASEVTLRVLETITAGTVPRHTVDSESASRIMTGAPMPAGADCVVPIERVGFDERGPETVTVQSSDITAERHVLRQGYSAQAGEPLLPAGVRVAPQHIAVLAEFGVAQVPVHRRGSVAVLATGDELLSIEEPLTPGRIRNSNEPMLLSQIQRAGATAVPLGVAKDSRGQLGQKIRQGLQSDFLLLSGGVSAGTLDLVPSELAAAGVDQVFYKIQMKPGKPLWFGQLQLDDHRCWVFGLPGNPVSSMICFELFVRTALRKFSGLPSPEPAYLSATLTQSLNIRGDRPTYFPTKLEWKDTGLNATPVPWGGSADLRSTADANGMCLLKPTAEGYAVGDRVPALPW